MSPLAGRQSGRAPHRRRTGRLVSLLVFAGGVVFLCGCGQKQPATEVAKATTEPRPAPKAAPAKKEPKGQTPKAEAPPAETPKDDTPPKGGVPPAVPAPGIGLRVPPNKIVKEIAPRPAKKFNPEEFPAVEKWGEVKTPGAVWVVLFPEQPASKHTTYETPGGATVETDEAWLKREYISGCVMLVRDDQFDRKPTTDEFESDNKVYLAQIAGLYGIPVDDLKAATTKTNGHFTRDYSCRGHAMGDFDIRRVLVIGKTKVRILSVVGGGPAVRGDDRKLFLDSLKIAENP